MGNEGCVCRSVGMENQREIGGYGGKGIKNVCVGFIVGVGYSLGVRGGNV